MLAADRSPLNYDAARAAAHNAQLLLFRPRKIKPLVPETYLAAASGQAIRFASRGGEWCHAAMGALVDGRWLALEMVEGVGYRELPIELYSKTHSGLIDVFDPSPLYPFDADRAVAYMRSLRGKRYGWCGILGSATLHVPLLWHLTRYALEPDADRDVRYKQLFCSSAVAAACQNGGGCDAVHNLSIIRTYPSDLSLGGLYGGGYRYTLTAESGGCQSKPPELP